MTVSLDTRIARIRVLYPAPTITAPSVLVIDVPEANRGKDLPLGRYYPVIFETEAEHSEMEQFLKTVHPAPRLPDIFDLRPSQIVCDQVLVWRYDPPEPGWPWLSVYRWPPNAQRLAAAQGVSMARGCYSIEVYPSRELADDLDVAVLVNLRANGGAAVQVMASEQLGRGGNA